MRKLLLFLVQVDIITWRSKNSRVHAQIKGICAILSGLVVAQDYKKGQALVQDRSFVDNSKFFQQVYRTEIQSSSTEC